MRGIGVGGILEHSRVEMTEMPINELADAAHLYFINSSSLCFLDLMQNLYRDSQMLITLFLPETFTTRQQEFEPPEGLASGREGDAPFRQRLLRIASQVLLKGGKVFAELFQRGRPQAVHSA